MSAGPVGGNGSFNAEVAGGYAFDTIPSGVSEDGARTYFVTQETLVSEDTDSSSDIYQRENGVTTIVSDDASMSGDPNVAPSYAGISADGSSAFFVTSEALNTDTGPSDTDGSQDVYVRDDGVLKLLSAGEINGNGPFGASFVSFYVGTRWGSGATHDGDYAVFETSEQLTVDDNDSSRDVYGRNLTTGVTARLSRGTGSDNGAFDASFGGMSQDGAHVFFTSTEQILAEDTDSHVDVYDRRPGAATTERVSRGTAGGSGNGAFDASIRGSSTDGTRVFFHTNEQLDVEDLESSQDVYERNLNANTTSMLSGGSAVENEFQTVEVVAEGGTFTLTFDGQTTGDIAYDATGAAFQAELEALSNIAPGDISVVGNGSIYEVYFQGTLGGRDVPLMTADGTNLTGDIHEVWVGGQTEGCCIANGAIPATFARASEDGTRVFFTTGERLAGTDADNQPDIYKRDGSSTIHISQGAVNGNGPFAADFTDGIQFDVSADGSHVFFETNEGLVSGDGDGQQDIYERFGSTTTLVSGNGPTPAYFAGASADGTKAGFLTMDSLLAGDTDGGRFDGYMRVGGVLLLASIGPLNDGVPDNGPYDVNPYSGGASRDGGRVYFQAAERFTADDVDGAEDVYYLATSDAMLQTAPPGGTVSTGGSPTSTDPLETDVTPPGGGLVRITESAPSQAPPVGYSLLGYQAAITANPSTPPTAANPIVLRFRLDSSLLPAGYDESAPGCGHSPSQCVQVFRNGVQAGTCLTPGNASPSPCVDARTQPGGPGGDIEIKVLTLSASNWNFGTPEGTLVVVKNTVPDDPQDFDFTTDSHLSPPTFSLDDDADGTLSNTQTFNGVAPGDHYSVTEAVPAGWVQTSAVCDDGSPVSDIEISAGETVTCTFTNHKQGTIVVVKDATPDDPQDFDFTGGNLSPATFSLDDDGDNGNALSNTRSFDVPPGSGYSLSESVPTGWDQTGATCSDGSPVSNIDVSAGETVTCTFANRKRGRVIVVKDTTPDDPQDFQFSAGGGLSPTSFTLDDDGDNSNALSNTRTFDNVVPGSGYSVSEPPPIPVGWELNTARCDDNSPPSNINVSAGETVTCTFINSAVYVRPAGASPLLVPLVPAYEECTTPNSQHGPPLDQPSCSPATSASQASDFLTVGTPDANGQPAKSVGSIRYSVTVGNLGPPEDADVKLQAKITDVRMKSDLSDYPGSLLGHAMLRITDKSNGSMTPGPTYTQSGTVEDIPFPFGIPCSTTPDPSVGSTCSVMTTANALVGGSNPPALPERKRTIYALEAIEVYDGGNDQIGHTTGDNTLFMKQGIFIP